MSLDGCAYLVARGDPDRFDALLAMPPMARARLLPLFAFHIEISRAPWASREAMICEMRLQWWRDIITEPKPRAHEVAAPLHDLIRSAALPLDLLDQMIAARIWDVYSDPFENEADFTRYLDQTSGGLYLASGLALGGGSEPMLRAYGYAAGLAAYFRAVPELERRGRKPLVDGRPTAVKSLAEQALDGLNSCGNTSDLGPAWPAVLPAWQARALLRQVVKDPMIVANGQMGLSEFSRRGRLIWASITRRV